MRSILDFYGKQTYEIVISFDSHFSFLLIDLNNTSLLLFFFFLPCLTTLKYARQLVRKISMDSQDLYTVKHLLVNFARPYFRGSIAHGSQNLHDY